MRTALTGASGHAADSLSQLAGGGPALLSPCVLLLRVIEGRRAGMQKAHLIFIRVSFA